MKKQKALLSVLLLLLLVSASSAQVFIGSKQAGMGGAGVASSVGLNAVAYNPAGLMKGPSAELLLSVGVASQGMDKLLTSMGGAGNPSSFLADNVNNTLDVNGNLFGIAGFSFNKIAVSLIVPRISANLAKQAGTIAGTANIGARYDLALTGGKTLTLPAFPLASLDLGASLKSINYSYGMLSATGALPFTANQYWGQGSGMGFDLGARTTLDIPAFSSFSLGIAIRDLMAKVNVGSPKMRQDTYNLNNTITTGTEQADTTQVPAGDYNLPTSMVLGCAATVPVIDLRLAADIESISGGTGPLGVPSDTITHLGLEYPLLFKALLLRGGIASSQYISLTTLGAKINAPFLMLELAAIFDNKNTKNNSFVVDAGFGF
jgi:hypothetical protein